MVPDIRVVFALPAPECGLDIIIIIVSALKDLNSVVKITESFAELCATSGVLWTLVQFAEELDKRACFGFM